MHHEETSHGCVLPRLVLWASAISVRVGRLEVQAPGCVWG